jgi:protein ImuB
MLWIALHFPRLPLEAYAQASASTEAHAVADGGRVLVCNPRAATRGARAGMSIAAASALVPDLVYRQRDAAAERAALEQLATWALQFTPGVSLQAPSGLLLEIEGSLKLFGGIKTILGLIRRGAADMGYTLSIAVAPTVAAAWLLARAGSEKIVSCKRVIEAAVAPLNVRALDYDAQTLATLAAVGVKTVGAALQLPRDGAARRFGPQFFEQLDRVLGTRPEARRFFTPAEKFSAKLELGASVEQAEALLFSAQRLLVQLAGFLGARCGSVQHFKLRLAHEDLAPTTLEIGLATPTRDPARFVAVVRERLAVLKLAAPVLQLALEADDILVLAGENKTLFAEMADRSADWAKLIERLSARLGGEAVHGLSPRAEHRPEHAWQRAAPGARPVSGVRPAPRPRPLWLLREPRPLRQVAEKPYSDNGPLAIVAGPERIESGWWDGGDVKRDYFVAQTAERSTVWVYRERRRPGGWYLHGIFG